MITARQVFLHGKGPSSSLGSLSSLVLPGELHAHGFPIMIFLDLQFQKHLEQLADSASCLGESSLFTNQVTEAQRGLETCSSLHSS